MLAKQAWRILLNPNSLVARVLEARYFLICDILIAKLGNSPSYSWRIICNIPVIIIIFFFLKV